MNASDGAAGAREMSRPAGRCIGSRAHCPQTGSAVGRRQGALWQCARKQMARCPAPAQVSFGTWWLLMEVVEFLKNPDRYKRLGGKIPKGVLIVGGPDRTARRAGRAAGRACSRAAGVRGCLNRRREQPAARH